MNRFGKIITAIMYSIAFVCTMGISLQARGQNGNGSHNGHEYVDLGLPSGTLWATCNVGAGTPEASGYYFAWGETQPKPTYSVKNCKYSIFDNNRYRYYQERGISAKEYEYYKYTKYSDSDHLIILQPDDDAATIQWGNGWHSPTYIEWNELIAYCNLKLTYQNEVLGMLVTAPNGNSIFLPAVGYRDINDLYGMSENGLYWSSSLDDDTPNYAYYFLYGNSGRYKMSQGDRYLGCSVRAVRTLR